MTNIRRYTVEDKPLWDAFVAKSRNSTFLFLRNYMEYHRQRFTDHSLLCFDIIHLDAQISEELKEEIERDGVTLYEKTR